MVLLIGHTGYVGTVFLSELRKAGVKRVGINSAFGITFESLCSLIARLKVSFVINAAGYTGKPNVDACERPENKAAVLADNVFLPGVIRAACAAMSVPFGHVSSGCLYNGAGPFTEEDKPNHHSFYSDSKAIAESILAGSDSYLWRLRMPFSSVDSPRNYLSKLLQYETLITEANSISHVEDFVRACIALMQKEAPFGAYNITNPGSITPKEIINIARRYGLTTKEPAYVASKDLPGIVAARSNCTLDTTKLQSQGIILPDVREAIKDSLKNFQRK